MSRHVSVGTDGQCRFLHLRWRDDDGTEVHARIRYPADGPAVLAVTQEAWPELFADEPLLDLLRTAGRHGSDLGDVLAAMRAMGWSHPIPKQQALEQLQQPPEVMTALQALSELSSE